ncbi:unnamed protein product, partial [Gulo gulo]
CRHIYAEEISHHVATAAVEHSSCTGGERGTDSRHSELSKVMGADPKVGGLLASPFYVPEDISLRISLK